MITNTKIGNRESQIANQGLNTDQDNDPLKQKIKTQESVDQKNQENNGEHNQNKKNLSVQTKSPVPQMHKIDVDQQNNKWEELKITGSNIMNRSYGSCAIHEAYFYVYGGYEVNQGILSDFWRIKIVADQYKWEKVRVRNESQGPGPRTRHSLTTFRNKLYLFGGQFKSQISTNNLFAYDFNDCTWEKVKQKGEIPPEIDSHCTIKNDSGQMIVLLGYFSQLGEYSNAVYQYDFESFTWKKRFQQNFEPGNISGRVNSSAVIAKNSIYVFGGYDGQSRLNDLWQFNLLNNQWQKVMLSAPIVPQTRSGHQMTYYKNYIALFGGIHDITHELDDLYIFSIEKSQWIEMEKCTQVIKLKQVRPASQENGKSLEDKSPKKQNRSRSKHKTQFIKESPMRKQFGQAGGRLSLFQQQNSTSIAASTLTQGQFTGFSIVDHNDENNENYEQNKQYQQGGSPTLPPSPTKNIQEKKRREFLHQKAEMLKLFETNYEQFDNKDTSPTSEAMKNSLARIGNPNSRIKVKPGRLTDFGKTTTSRFLEPLRDAHNSKKGKKPCARDGSIAELFKNKWIIFGGDRHKMSFNDIFSLDFDQIIHIINSGDFYHNNKH